MVAMPTAPVPSDLAAPEGALRRTARVVGVDVARCLALLGMMATHILPNVDQATGAFVPWHQQLAGGRSAALFAVLAGVSLALVTGRERPMRGRPMAAARVGIVLRALAIACIGLLLGGLESGVAVILAYYGVLFVLAIPFLGLGWRPLALLAAVWAVGAPVVSQLVREQTGPGTYAVASFEQLVADPVGLLTELTVTGYYPAFSWLAYVLAGLAVGRLALSTTGVAMRIAVFGGVLALGSWVVATLVVHNADVHALLEESVPRRLPESNFLQPPGSLDLLLAHGFYGTTPTTTWQWLWVVAPHSATPMDLLHTIGTSLLVLGLCLLAGQRLPRLLGTVFAAGTMTLTLYTFHVVALAEEVGPDRGPALYAWHVAAALLVGALWRRFLGQGPLERGVAGLAAMGSVAVLEAGRDRTTAPGGPVHDHQQTETGRSTHEGER